MICCLCKLDQPVFWSDWERSIGRFDVCKDCCEEVMPEELDLFNKCNQCGRYFRFRWISQRTCGFCFRRSKDE